MRLTDITIKSLKAPQHGARIYTDDIVSGFGVRISQGGTKSFVLTHGPRHQRETIGRIYRARISDCARWCVIAADSRNDAFLRFRLTTSWKLYKK
jgi:hypothetical protein